MQSSRLQGNGFPKVPNQGPSSAIFPLLFPSQWCNQFVITLCMPRHSRQPYNLQLWGLLGGRDGGRVRKRERGGAWGVCVGGGVVELKKKSQEAALSGEKKMLRLLPYLSSSAHQRHKCLNLFSPSHPCEMRSLSVILHSPPPSFYLFSMSIRQKHFDRVKLRPNVWGGLWVCVCVCV